MIIYDYEKHTHTFMQLNTNILLFTIYFIEQINKNKNWLKLFPEE